MPTLNRIALAAALAALTVPSHAYSTLIGGFDSFNLGPLESQNGWQSGRLGTGSTSPEIVDFMGKRAAQLSVGDNPGDESFLFRPFDHSLDLVADGYRQCRVTFQIYRLLPASGRFSQNLYWWFMGDNPDYGMQWDADNPETSYTIPVGAFSNSSLIETRFGAWTKLSYEYDFDARTYSSWYGGVQVDFSMPMDLATVDAYREMNGYRLSLRHESAAGAGLDVAYLADLSVEAVPEPWSVSALMVGVAALALRRRPG